MNRLILFLLLTFSVNWAYAQNTCTGNVPIENLSNGMDYSITVGTGGMVDIIVTVVDNPPGLVGFLGGPGNQISFPDASGTFTYNLTGQPDPYVLNMFFNWEAGGQGNSTPVSCSSSPSPSVLEIPIDFDDPSIDYDLVPFGGNMSAMIGTDPDDPSNSVLTATKLPGAPCWAGVTVGGSCLANPVPFGPGNMIVYIDVYSPEAGTPVLLKVEDCGNAGISSEVLAVTTVANEWETLAFDFENDGCPAAPNLANSYSRLSIFPQFTCTPDACGNPNPGTAPFSTMPYHFDNVSMTPPPPVAPSLPMDFGEANTVYNMAGFGGANGVIGVDPTDPSNEVLCITEDPGAQCWAGVTVGGPAPFCLEEPVDFSAGTTITMDVYSPQPGASILLKFEDCSNSGISTELIAVTTTSNAWETLTFDFSNGCGAPPNPNNTYNKMSIFAQFACSPDACGNQNPNTAEPTASSYYFDNIQQVAAPPNEAAVTFCLDLSCDYAPPVAASVIGVFNNGNAGANMLVDQGNGIWCTTVQLAPGTYVYKFFDQASNPQRENLDGLPCTTTDPFFGAETFRFVEVLDNSPITVTNGWESCDAACSPPPPRPDLKIDFESMDIDYSLSDFAGNVSMIGVDPVFPPNNVLQINKTAGAACFAGTIVGNFGLENPIPFTATEQRMVLQVYSPAAGTPFLLKVEDATNGAISSEVLAFTTVANEWELLVFDFTNGSPAVNLANTYDKVIVFPEFTCSTTNAGGSGLTYYVDNINFYSDPIVELNCPADAQVTGCGAVDAPPFADFAAFEAAGGSAVDGNPVTFRLINTTESGMCPLIVEHEYEITDFCGFKDSCTHITEVAPAAPTIVCPPDEVVTCFEDINADPNNLVVTTSCGQSFTAYVKQPLITGGIPGCDGVTYTYIYKVVDECGNVAECEQMFLLQNDAPTVTVTPGGTFNCYEDIEVSEADATVTTDCEGDYTLVIIPPDVDGAICPGETIDFTYRVTDFCGRQVEVVRTFTSTNNIGPVITSIPLDYTTDCADGFGSNPELFSAEANCGDDITYTVSGPNIIGTPGCSGSIAQYTYTAEDECGRTASHVQTITFVNDGPILSCPETLNIVNCQDGDTNDLIEAWIATVTATSTCGGEISVNNNFNGNPGMCLGNNFTNVTFFATDECGVTNTCIGTIIITDTEAPIIYEQPEELLVPCNGVTQDIFDEWLDNNGGAEAIDGCWGNDISWSTNPSNPSLNCNEGPQAIVVEFIATDGCGNASSVTGVFTTKLQPDVINVSGMVQREDTEPVADVEIGIEGSTSGLPDLNMTASGGNYGIPELDYEDNMTVVPHKDDDHFNGISTYDLILLQQHIVMNNLLDSPYKIIAADINNSGHVSTLDLVLLRRLVLFIDEELEYNDSWRFVEASYVFPNPSNPFETDFPEVYAIGGLEQEEADFIAVKIGDLNLDAEVNGFTGGADDRDLDDLVFEIENDNLERGTQRIDVKAQNFETINGYQMTINLSSAVEVLDIESGALASFDESNFYLGRADQGIVTMSWNAQEAQSYDTDEVLFSIVVNVKEALQTSDAITVTSAYTKAEAYQNGNLMNVNLAFNQNGQTATVEKFQLFQNQPNPFKDATVVGFNLPESGTATLLVYDISGRLVHQQESDFAKGYNQFNIDRTLLAGSGVFYYHVNTEHGSAAKKMILMD